MKKCIIIFLNLFIWICSFAQSGQYGNTRFFEFNSVDFGSSRVALRTQTSSIEEFKSLMLTPQLNFINANDFQLRGNQIRNVMTSIQVGAGFHIQDNKNSFRGNPLVRFGLGFTQSNLHYASFEANSSTTIDSVSVPNSSVLRPLDSINTTTLTFFSRQGFLSLSASVLWQTDPNLRFCLYGGIGVGFGVTTNSQVSFNYNQTTHKEVRYSNGAIYDRYDYQHTSKSVSTDALPWHFVSFSAPIGIDFRLGNRDRFWNYLHLFFEVGPSFQIISAQQMNPINNYGLWTSWGCRFRMFESSTVGSNRYTR